MCKIIRKREEYTKFIKRKTEDERMNTKMKMILNTPCVVTNTIVDVVKDAIVYIWKGESFVIKCLIAAVFAFIFSCIVSGHGSDVLWAYILLRARIASVYITDVIYDRVDSDEDTCVDESEDAFVG